MGEWERPTSGKMLTPRDVPLIPVQRCSQRSVAPLIHLLMLGVLAKAWPWSAFFFPPEVQPFRHFWQFGFKMWNKETRSVVPGEKLYYTITKIIQKRKKKRRNLPEYCGHYVFWFEKSLLGKYVARGNKYFWAVRRIVLSACLFFPLTPWKGLHE